MGIKITTGLSGTSQTQASKNLKTNFWHCNENKGSEKWPNQLAESGIEKEECAEACVVPAQMKEKQGFHMSNNGSTSKSQPRSAPQYQQHQYQPTVPLMVPIDGQQKEVGESPDKLSQIQKQHPKLNRDLEWRHRRANGTFHHRLQGDQDWHHICDNCLFFGGRWQQPVLPAMSKPCSAQMLQIKHLFAHPMCLSQLHSPSFLSEVTNVVPTHCGCSHVADEPKQLIPCFKK